MPRKRNKLQQRRSDEKKREKLNRENYMHNQQKFQQYAQEVYNESVQIMKLNAYKNSRKEEADE